MQKKKVEKEVETKGKKRERKNEEDRDGRGRIIVESQKLLSGWKIHCSSEKWPLWPKVQYDRHKSV